jgi:hypothetical protein
MISDVEMGSMVDNFTAAVNSTTHLGLSAAC